MPIQKWSLHPLMQIGRVPMTRTMYSICRPKQLYLAESLGLSQSRDSDCLLLFGSCGVS